MRPTHRYVCVLLFFLTSAFGPAKAQVCEGDFELETQTEVNAFDCVEVTGNLLVSGNSITDLSPLAELTSIGGNLVLSWNGSLIDLVGFESLTSVGGYLSIGSNYGLRRLSGLDKLTSIGDFLSIQRNEELLNLNGLGSLTSVGGIWLYDNQALTSVDGLERLTTANGDVGIYLNYGLSDLTGFESLATIAGNFRIHVSDITQLAGLESLASIEGTLWIEGNDKLTNVDALANLTSVGADLDINDNPSLSECTVGLAELLINDGVGGSSFIDNNAPGCNSVWEAMGGAVDAEDEAAPLVTGLAAPYPNPTAGGATLTYSLAEPDGVTLAVYDALGRRVRRLAEGPHAAGAYAVTLDAGLPAGTYVVRFETGGKAWSERVTVVR